MRAALDPLADAEAEANGDQGDDRGRQGGKPGKDGPEHERDDEHAANAEAVGEHPARNLHERVTGGEGGQHVPEQVR